MSEELDWIDSQISSGMDVTFSQLHEHSAFGPAVVMSVRRGYATPTRFYGETVAGVILTASTSELLGEQEEAE